MNIIVNGQTHDVPEGYTAGELINSLKLLGKRIAMEVNEEIVPKSAYSSFVFASEDNIEIVHAVGGG